MEQILLDKLVSILSSPSPSPTPSSFPSHLLTSLVRAACFIDLYSSTPVQSRKKDAHTQTVINIDLSSSDASPLQPTKENSPEEDCKEFDNDRNTQSKKRIRNKENKSRKKKKGKKKKRYCSSPSYSDYEPENPILRKNRR